MFINILPFIGLTIPIGLTRAGINKSFAVSNTQDKDLRRTITQQEYLLSVELVLSQSHSTVEYLSNPNLELLHSNISYDFAHNGSFISVKIRLDERDRDLCKLTCSL